MVYMCNKLNSTLCSQTAIENKKKKGMSEWQKIDSLAGILDYTYIKIGLCVMYI